jgi:hypothetical protein
MPIVKPLCSKRFRNSGRKKCSEADSLLHGIEQKLLSIARVYFTLLNCGFNQRSKTEDTKSKRIEKAIYSLTGVKKQRLEQ